jgi:hypothetical protein
VALVVVAVVAPLAHPTGRAQAAETPTIEDWSVADLDLPANDAAYDHVRNRFLATVDATDSFLGNELVELDPRTGALGRHVAVGSQPEDIEITDDASTAYVALGGTNRIVQVDLATFTVIRSWALPVEPYEPVTYAEDLEVLPGRNDVVVAVLERPSGSPRFDRVIAFRDGMALPDRVDSSYPGYLTVTSLESIGGDRMLGLNLFDTRREVTELTVDDAGVRAGRVTEPEWAGQDGEYAAGRFYGVWGDVIDPNAADGPTQVSEYRDVFRGPGMYYVEPVPAAGAGSVVYLEGQRMVAKAPGGGTRTFSGLPMFPTGLAAARGTFAVTSTWGLYLVGPGVGPNALVRPAKRANHLDNLVIQGTDHRVEDVVQDPVRDQLYLAVSSYVAPGRLDRIDAIDPATGEIVRSLPMPMQPSSIDVSDDGTTMWVGFRSSGLTKIGKVRLDLPVMVLTEVHEITRNPAWPMPWRGIWVRDLSIKPGDPDSVAVALSESPVVLVRDGEQTTTEFWGAQIEWTQPGAVWGTHYLGVGAIVIGSDGSLTYPDGFDFGAAFDGLRSGGGRLFASSKVIDVDDPEHPAVIADLGTGFDAIDVTADGTTAFTVKTGVAQEHDVSRGRRIHTEEFRGYNGEAVVRTSAGLAVLEMVSAPNGLEPAVLLIRPPKRPTVAALSESHGHASGGNKIKLTGSELRRTTSVRFGATEAAFSVNNDNSGVESLRVTVPDGVPGDVDVTVTSSGGTSTTHAATRYTYDTEAGFHRIGPWRVLDTREPQPTPYTPAAGQVIRVKAPEGDGIGGYNSEAAAVWLSVTAVGGTTPGWLTVWPCDRPMPPTSSVNVTDPGQIVANLVLAELGPSRELCVFTSQPTHVVIDLHGSVPKRTGYRTISAARAIDTRGASGNAPRPGPGSVTRVQVTGRGGIPSTGVGAVALNVTATAAAGPGWVTAWSCDRPRPLASTLNVDRGGQTVANFAAVDVGSGGAVCLYSSAGAHLIADVVGWWGAGVFRPSGPVRVFDTRPGPEHKGSISLYPGATTEVVLTSFTDIPAGEWAGVILNVTLANGWRPGYVTVYPRGEQLTTSNLNVLHSGQTVASAVVLGPSGDDDRFYVYSEGGGDVIIDVIGWLPEVDPPADD